MTLWTRKNSSGFKRVAHRGASGEVPENTLPAVALALQRYQTDLVELDLRLTKDGVPVILHDETLERTTNGKGPVRRQNFRELKTLDAGFRFDPEGKKSFPFRGKGITVPALEEVLRGFPESGFLLEIKEKDPECVPRILNVIERVPAKGNLLMASFHGPVIRTVRGLRPTFIRTALSRGEVFRAWLAFRFKAKNYFPPAHLASLPLSEHGLRFDDPDWIAFLHERGVGVFYWTVDEPKEMERLIGAGVDGILTNFPERLNRVMGL